MNAAISYWKTGLGPQEIAAVSDAIANGRLSDGALCAEFEREAAETLGVPYALVVPSGSVALLMSMLALGIGPGDEVIIPDCTWIATAHAAALLGAKTVLVDTLPDRPVIDPAAVAASVTSRTKAIIPVHLGGRAADIDAILAVARPRGIPVIEDACQAILSRSGGHYLGTTADIGCYSLGVVKLLTTGQGGLAVTSNKTLYDAMKRAKFHGVQPSPGGWEQYTGLGLNLKFTDMQAAIGKVQLQLAPERVKHVTDIYRTYQEGLGNLPLVRVSPIDIEDGEVPLWTELETPHVEKLAAFLAAEGIQTRRVHPPLHEAPHLSEGGEFPNATRFAYNILVLPSGPAMPLESVRATIEAIRRFSV